MDYQFKKLFEILATFAGFVALCFVVAAVGIHFYFQPVIASKERIMNNNDTGLVLLDDRGTPFFTFYQAKNRKYVTLEDIADTAEKAAVAVEDKEFYQHRGVSPRGIARSIVRNIEERSFSFGGSTITQQLVKNTLLTPDKSIVRKFREAVLSYEIESKYEKSEILEMYLNSVYFGEGAFGIEQAANIYFGKKAADLTLAESSFLMGILPAPSVLSPYSGDREAAYERQKYVLSQMLEVDYITQAEKTSAENTKLVFTAQSEDLNVIAPHFALMIRDELVDKYGEEYIARSGLHVRTTLNSAWQEKAEEVVARNVQRLAGNEVTNGAVVVMEPASGAIKTLVGSRDWYNEDFGKVNMANTPRQPGSSFKPIVYATALEDRDITMATVLSDKKTDFRIANCQSNCTYSPKNYDNRYRGNVLVRRALANSLNVPAVEVMQKVGVQRVLEKAADLNINSLKDASNYGPSLVLGSGEVPLVQMTSAFSAFANRGKLAHYKLYTDIIDKSGRDINGGIKPVRVVFSEQVAYIISSILSDNRARAEVFGSALTISRPAAVKTGTTENYRDAWTIGYTPDLVVGVWVGNNDNSEMDQVAGSLGAAPIWRELMTEFSRGVPIKRFEPPTGLARLSICSNGGVIKAATTSAQTEFFLPGTEPTKACVIREITQDSESSGSAQQEVQGISDENKERESNDDDSLERDVEQLLREFRNGRRNGRGNNNN